MLCGLALVTILLATQDLLAIVPQQLDLSLPLDLVQIRFVEPIVLPSYLGFEQSLAGLLNGDLEIFLILVDELSQRVLAHDFAEVPSLAFERELRLNLLQGWTIVLLKGALLHSVHLPLLVQVDDGFRILLRFSDFFRHLRDEVKPEPVRLLLLVHDLQLVGLLPVLRVVIALDVLVMNQYRRDFLLDGLSGQQHVLDELVLEVDVEPGAVKKPKRQMNWRKIGLNLRRNGNFLLFEHLIKIPNQLCLLLLCLPWLAPGLIEHSALLRVAIILLLDVVELIVYLLIAFEKSAIPRRFRVLVWIANLEQQVIRVELISDDAAESLYLE